MREPRYPLPRVVLVTTDAAASPPALRGRGGRGPSDLLSFPWRFPRRGWVVGPHDERAGSDGEGGEVSASPPPPRRPTITRVRGHLLCRIRQ